MNRPSDPDHLNPYSTDPESARSTTALLEREVEEQLEDPGDHDRYAHYVQKEKIAAATISGSPVVALCGKVWVPGRDPKKYPLCPTCKEIYEGLKNPGGDDKSGNGKKGGFFGGFFGK